MTGNYSLPSTPLFTDLVGTQATGRSGESDEHVRLSDDQLARLRAAAKLRRFTTGEVLLEPGERDYAFMLLGQGRAELVRLATPDRAEAVLDRLSQGDFVGEWGLISGDAALLATRATEPGLLFEIPRARFLELLAEDAELSRVIMREMLRRRDALRAGEGAGSVEILGAAQSPASHALRSWAERQRIAFTWLDVNDDAGAALARALGCGMTELPVAITPTATIQRATARQLSDNLGLTYHDVGRILDLVVVGAGPAGLAAAVYGASEGLSTLLLDAASIGGQAASSPRIENFLGFPDGISGEELTSRGVIQAQKFGAIVSTPSVVDGLEPVDDDIIRVHLEDGTDVRARAVLIATGAKYRRLTLARWHDFEGASIFFAATEIEAEFCRDKPVVVLGGANSSGQAALFLASRASSVSLVIRHDKLEAEMSDYLARRIRQHPRIDIHLGTEVTALHGRDRLTAVDLTRHSDSVQQRQCVGLFCFIGATPATGWLDGVSLDDDGFVLTDTGLTDEELPPVWAALGRHPLPFETSIPRVFAVGDVRRGSTKRVAAAVGEGSSAIPSVHHAITAPIKADTAGPPTPPAADQQMQPGTESHASPAIAT